MGCRVWGHLLGISMRCRVELGLDFLNMLLILGRGWLVVLGGFGISLELKGSLSIGFLALVLLL